MSHNHYMYIDLYQSVCILVGQGGMALLQQVKITVISQDVCEQPSWRYDEFKVGDYTICAGKTEGGKDSCQVRLGYIRS